MRFLVLTDIHMRDRVIGWANRLVEAHDADALMVLGDITQFGPPEWAGEFLSAFDVPAYAVHGNCDPPLVLGWIEKTAVSLHKTRVQLDGETLIGLGGSNPTIFDTPNEQSEVEIYESLIPIMETGAIMVTHCPPYGINDMTRHGHHAGSHSLLRISKEFRPKAWLAGHIHEARGIVEVDGTKYMNPGAAKDGFSGLLEIGGSIGMELLDRVD
jgi:Icc-related predicted phosphoesterase